MTDGKKMSSTFWEHTVELFTRVRTIVYALSISSLAVMLVPINLESLRLSLTDPIYETLAAYTIKRVRADLLPPGVELLPMDWFAPFSIYLSVSLFLGAVICSPVTIYEVYKFLNPALRKKERKFIFLFTSSFMLLFVFGVIFGYVLIVPTTFRMLTASAMFLKLTPQYEFSSFFSIVLGGLSMTGLMFTFPVFFLSLVKAQIVKTSHVTKKRRYVYALVFVLIAVLTPDPTLVTDILIFLPIILMIEVSIIIGKRIEKARPN